MDPASRSLIRITLPAEYQDRQPVKDLVERLMGKNPEHRFNFIQANAANLSEHEMTLKQINNFQINKKSI